MAFISLPGIPWCSNPSAQRVSPSPVFLRLIQRDVPVTSRFLVRPRLLTRLSALPRGGTSSDQLWHSINQSHNGKMPGGRKGRTLGPSLYALVQCGLLAGFFSRSQPPARRPARSGWTASAGVESRQPLYPRHPAAGCRSKLPGFPGSRWLTQRTEGGEREGMIKRLPMGGRQRRTIPLQQLR